MHERTEFSAFDNILFFAKDFTEISLQKISSSFGS
jgi:hypothetical protein